jgi:hypothetical protein
LLTLMSIAVPWIAPVASAAICSTLGVAPLTQPWYGGMWQDVAGTRDYCSSLYQIKNL